MLNTNNKRYLIAVSGGKDSITLLDYFVKKLKNPQKQLIVAHFDHQIRPNSAGDLAFVQSLAQKHKLTFISKTADIPHLNKGNLEATARHHRYQFFETVRQQFKLDYIVTAHHQDDQIETILLNWNRGAGLKGLQGMSIYDPNRKLLRPFLKLSSKSIQTYLHENKLDFVQDPTNFDTTYSRNQLRHQIIPQLVKKYPDFKKTILEASVLSQELNNFYFQQLINSPLKLLKAQNGYKFSRQYFQNASPQLQSYFLHQCFTAFKLPISKANLTKARQLINQKSSGQKIEQANTIIWIDSSYIHFTHSTTQTKSQPIQIDLNTIKQELTLNWNQHRLKITRTNTPQPNTLPIKTNYTSLTIRSFKPGDRIKPLGLGGTKKIKNVLIDKKVPQRHRLNLPIITTGQEILGIPNLIASESCRINAQNHCHFAITLVDS